MSTSTSLSIELKCIIQSASISFPVVSIVAKSPLTGFINSIGHFVACEARQHNNAAMEYENNYNIYNKTAAGAIAGAMKYSFNHWMTSPHGVTKIAIASGAMNNIWYHLEPEIKNTIANNIGETASSLYSYISPIFIETVESVLLYEIGNANIDSTLRGSMKSGAKTGALLSAFCNIVYPHILESAPTVYEFATEALEYFIKNHDTSLPGTFHPMA